MSRTTPFPAEVLGLIFAHVDCSSCRKSLRAVNKLFNKLVGPGHTLSRLIKSIAEVRPDELHSLDWSSIVSKPAGLPPFEDMPALHQHIDPVALCKNQGVTLEFFLKYPLAFNWSPCWTALSENPAMTEEIIRANLNLRWDWAAFAKNSSLSCDFYLDFCHKPIKWSEIQHLSTTEYLRLAEYPISWEKAWRSCEKGNGDYVVSMRLLLLAQAPNIIKLDIALDRTFKPLNIFKIAKEQDDLSPIWQRLSLCPDILIEHVRARPSANWNFAALGKRIALREKLDSLQFPWCLTLIQAENPPPIAFVNENPLLNWPASFRAHWYSPEVLLAQPDWEKYSADDWRIMSKKVDFATVAKHRSKPWDLTELSKRVDDTFLLAYPKWRWDFLTLSFRSGWSWDVILHPELLPKWYRHIWSSIDLSGPASTSNLVAAWQHVDAGHLSYNPTLQWETVAATDDILDWSYHCLGRFGDSMTQTDVLPDDFDMSLFSARITLSGYKKFKNLKWDAHTLLPNENIPIAEAMKWIMHFKEKFCLCMTQAIIDRYLDQNEIIKNLEYAWDFRGFSWWTGSNLCQYHVPPA